MRGGGALIENTKQIITLQDPHPLNPRYPYIRQCRIICLYCNLTEVIIFIKFISGGTLTYKLCKHCVLRGMLNSTGAQFFQDKLRVCVFGCAQSIVSTYPQNSTPYLPVELCALRFCPTCQSPC